jgi:hypothetical protein
VVALHVADLAYTVPRQPAGSEIWSFSAAVIGTDSRPRGAPAPARATASPPPGNAVPLLAVGLLRAWRWDYNEHHPHPALEGRSPGEYGRQMVSTAAASPS